MAEWFKEHAWKSDRFTRADAHQIPPTHSRSTTSLNTDTRRHVLVNHRVDRGFEGVCDTVLTQNRFSLPRTSTSTSRYAQTYSTTGWNLHRSSVRIARLWTAPRCLTISRSCARAGHRAE